VLAIYFPTSRALGIRPRSAWGAVVVTLRASQRFELAIRCGSGLLSVTTIHGLLVIWGCLSPKIGDVPQRKKLSTTIGADNYADLHKMVKGGRAESVGEAVDKAVEMARRMDNRATLERQTAAYFKGLPSKAAAEETDLEDALSAVSQEMDLDQP
jgi:hypothetical protein